MQQEITARVRFFDGTTCIVPITSIRATDANTRYALAHRNGREVPITRSVDQGFEWHEYRRISAKEWERIRLEREQRDMNAARYKKQFSKSHMRTAHVPYARRRKHVRTGGI